MTFDDHYYAAVTEELVRVVRVAARPDWQAYDGAYAGGVEWRAVFLARHAVSEARRMGRYPTTAALERELRKAA